MERFYKTIYRLQCRWSYGLLVRIELCITHIFTQPCINVIIAQLKNLVASAAWLDTTTEFLVAEIPALLMALMILPTNPFWHHLFFCLSRVRGC